MKPRYIKSILYVDDELLNLKAFKATFRREFHVFTAISAIEGRKILETVNVDVVVSDHQMPGMKGIEFLKSIISDFPKPVRILLTGYADPAEVKEAIHKGYVYKCILKPWNAKELQNEIESALQAGYQGG
jgi:CheY-like chemotaxis protein